MYQTLIARIPLLLLATFLTSLIVGCSQSHQAYDEDLDANAAVKAALANAKIDNKKVILIFGANWCTDCRVFDQALSQPSVQAKLMDSFEVVKIDIGDFDKHSELVAQYGNITKNGIPTLIVIDSDNHELFATRKGELRTARHLSEDDLSQFFTSLSELI